MATQRLTLDQYFMRMLALVAGRSTCGRRAVGAIIVDSMGHVLAMGYNGVPSGLLHCTNYPCQGRHDTPGNTDQCQAVHAEQNALLQCHRLDLAHTIYVSCTPCFTCAKMIANTKIERVVVGERYADDRGKRILEMLHIKVELYPGDYKHDGQAQG